MCWTRTAYYINRAEMESNIGRVAAAGWLVDFMTRLPDGGYQVHYSRIAPTHRDTDTGQGSALRPASLWQRSRT